MQAELRKISLMMLLFFTLPYKGYADELGGYGLLVVKCRLVNDLPHVSLEDLAWKDTSKINSLFKPSNLPDVKKLADLLKKMPPQKLRDLIEDAEYFANDLVSEDFVNKALRLLFYPQTSYSIMSEKDLLSFNVSNFIDRLSIAEIIGGNRPKFIYKNQLKSLFKIDDKVATELADAIILDLPSEKLFAFPINGKLFANNSFFAFLNEENLVYVMLCSYNFHSKFNYDFELNSSVDFDFILDENPIEKPVWNAPIFISWLFLDSPELLSDEESLGELVSLRRQLDDVILGANINGTGLIISNQNCKYPGKIWVSCTQIPVLSEGGLVVILTDKLDIKRRHELKAGKKVNFSNCILTEVQNARGIGKDKYSTFISDITGSLRQSLIQGLEAGRDSQSLPLALTDTAFGLTISLLQGEVLSVPIKTITCEIDHSDLVVAN